MNWTASLVSLRAEVRRREELLVSRPGSGSGGLPGGQARRSGPLPHLVLIIDEFRMLVEDAPEALTELMRIAAIGRSLGIHLIMATQRPQGALTADIRANVTTSIALRVQSEMESVDIINSRARRRHQRRHVPGGPISPAAREDPEEFQTASLAGAAAEPDGTGVRVRLAADALRHAAGRPRPATGLAPAPDAGPGCGPAD